MTKKIQVESGCVFILHFITYIFDSNFKSYLAHCLIEELNWDGWLIIGGCIWAAMNLVCCTW